MGEVIGLRLEQCSRGGTIRSSESARPASSGRGPRRGRILIMDDDPLIREVMRRQLVVFGYEVVASVEGQEAVAVFLQAHADGQPFDAVILDLLVPAGWGGEQTIGELKRLAPGVKALLCSGSLSGSVEHYERQGFCGVLGKPYAMEELRGMLEAVLLPPRDP